MYYVYTVVGIALVISLVASREKTVRALKVAIRRSS